MNFESNRVSQESHGSDNDIEEDAGLSSGRRRKKHTVDFDQFTAPPPPMSTSYVKILRGHKRLPPPPPPPPSPTPTSGYVDDYSSPRAPVLSTATAYYKEAPAPPAPTSPPLDDYR